MTPCNDCQDENAPMCDHWDICPEYQEFIHWRVDYERHADPQEERQIDMFIDDREV